MTNEEWLKFWAESKETEIWRTTWRDEPLAAREWFLHPYWRDKPEQAALWKKSSLCSPEEAKEKVLRVSMSSRPFRERDWDADYNSCFGVITEEGNKLIRITFNKELAYEFAAECAEGASKHSLERTECRVVEGINFIAQITGLSKDEIKNCEML